MWWRIKRREFEKQHGEGNHASMKAIVYSGEIPGLLFYLDGKLARDAPSAPGENYAALNRPPMLKRIDETLVCSLVCLFVGKEYRNQWLIQQLLQGAIDYVRSQEEKSLKLIHQHPRADASHPVQASWNYHPCSKRLAL